MKKKKSLLKKIIIAIIIFIIIWIVATIGIGNYFVEYAIARTGNGGDREVIEANALIQDNETPKEDIVEINRKKAKQSAKEWASEIKNKKVEVKAVDGITLKGIEYIKNETNNKWAVILHGYRSETESVLTIGEHFSKKDYNVLIPSMRGCGESEGDYIGMGWLDKDDVKCWIDLIIKENPNAEIVLHGSSMGAATVLMTSGEELPSNVKYIIADSGYTSVWDIFASEAKVRFNLPEFPFLNMFQVVAKARAGYDIKEASAIEQVKKSKTPILFIHGDMDDFVPKYMCDKLYEVANCKKEKLIIKGAGHTDSKYKEPDTYYNKIFEFIGLGNGNVYPDFITKNRYTVDSIRQFCNENDIELEIEYVDNTNYKSGTILTQSEDVESAVISGSTLKITVAK